VSLPLTDDEGAFTGPILAFIGNVAQCAWLLLS
jgi:hypothetical protein